MATETKRAIVETVIIDKLVLGTEHSQDFIDALERLCQHYASVSDAENGDGYTFKFKVA